MTMPVQNKKRIDDFIAVATERYDANPGVWEHIYNQLRKLLSSEDKHELERQWFPIVFKKELAEWDELFLSTTIDESELAKQIKEKDDYSAHKQAMELYMQQQQQQQLAGMQNARGYVNPYGGSTSSASGYNQVTSTAGGYATTAGMLHPTELTNPPTLVDRILGRK